MNIVELILGLKLFLYLGDTTTKTTLEGSTIVTSYVCSSVFYWSFAQIT